MRLLASILMVPLLGLVMLSAACGGDDDDPPAPAATATVAATPAPVVLNVTTLDNSFNPATASARAGQKVTVNVKNDGQRPHTFTIDGVVDSGRLNAGESKTVEFTPSTAGSLAFYCTIHTAAVMSGTLNVSASAAAESGEGVEMALAP
jgi:plastocyanin